MSRLIFLLLSLYWLLACTGSSATKTEDTSGAALEEIERLDDYGHTERFQRRITDSAREGRYQRFNADGVLIEEAFYQNDTLHGDRVLFYETGDTLSVEQYDMGSFEGEFRQYYENGKLQLRGPYVNNEMSGQWRQYYETGELMEIVTFANNLENGPFVEYYRNGELKAKGAYLNGDYEHGLLQLYNEAGELVRKMNCEEGVCRTIWRAEGEDS